MNAVDMEAVSPIEGLRLAVEALGIVFHVWAGDDLIEFFRSSSADIPEGASISFHIEQVPYRRRKDRGLIPPTIPGDFNREWILAPEEYIRCVNAEKQMLIPVKRPTFL